MGCLSSTCETFCRLFDFCSLPLLPRFWSLAHRLFTVYPSSPLFYSLSLLPASFPLLLSLLPPSSQSTPPPHIRNAQSSTSSIRSSLSLYFPPSRFLFPLLKLLFKPLESAPIRTSSCETRCRIDLFPRILLIWYGVTHTFSHFPQLNEFHSSWVINYRCSSR